MAPKHALTEPENLRMGDRILDGGAEIAISEIGSCAMRELGE
jgi:hypothetical protein